MSKKRSLGSDPLLGDTSVSQEVLGFIGQVAKAPLGKESKSPQDEKSDKKIVSYYIEKDLVKDIKQLSKLTDRCYSSLVSQAIRSFVKQYEF